MWAQTAAKMKTKHKQKPQTRFERIQRESGWTGESESAAEQLFLFVSSSVSPNSRSAPARIQHQELTYTTI